LVRIIVRLRDIDLDQRVSGSTMSKGEASAHINIGYLSNFATGCRSNSWHIISAATNPGDNSLRVGLSLTQCSPSPEPLCTDASPGTTLCTAASFSGALVARSTSAMVNGLVSFVNENGCPLGTIILTLWRGQLIPLAVAIPPGQLWRFSD
jgi:hypothetical protein